MVLRARRHRCKQDEENRAAQAPQPGEVFDARLDNLRQRVLSDPKVAASVVKLWLQGT